MLMNWQLTYSWSFGCAHSDAYWIDTKIDSFNWKVQIFLDEIIENNVGSYDKKYPDRHINKYSFVI